jgi:hypothetical protein
MLLMDMSQYEGEDRERVIAGYNALLDLNRRAPQLVTNASRYVAFGIGPATLASYLRLHSANGAPGLSREEAEAAVNYLQACDRIKRMVERLNGQPDRHVAISR